MKKKKSADNIFKRYLFSYLSVLIIPVIIFSVLIFGDFIKSTEKEVLQNNTYLLSKIQKTFDAQIRQLDKIAYQLYNDSAIKPFKLDDEPLKAIKISKDLLRYNVVNEFVDEIFIYMRGDKYIYSSTSSMTLQNFTHNLYVYDNWSEADFERDINESAISTFRPSEQLMLYTNPSEKTMGRFITYIYPLPKSLTKPFATILFLIPEKKIQDLISESTKTYNMLTAIVDRQNNILLQVGTNDNEDNNEMINIALNKPGSFSMPITTDNINFLVSKVESEESGFKYITIAPSLEVMNKVNDVKERLILGVLIILVLGFVVISYSIRIIYNPIKYLKVFAEEKLRKKSSLNEIDTIYLTLERLSEDNNNLDKRLYDNKSMIKELLLKTLLKGQINSEVMFYKIANNIGLTETYLYCLAAVIHIPGYTDLPKAKSTEILKDIEDCFTDGIKGFACDDIQQDRTSLILLTNENNTDKILACMSGLLRLLRQKYGQSYMYNIGNVYSTITKVNMSYFEASVSLDHALATRNTSTFRYADFIDSLSLTDNYLCTCLCDLEQTLVFGNFDIQFCNMTKLLEYASNHLWETYKGKYILFKLNGILIKMNEINKLSKAEKENVYPDVLSLAEQNSIVVIKNRIREQLDQITTCAKENPVSKNLLIDKMTAYIKHECTSFDFSINAMADAFNMNMAALSQYFKEHTGITLMQYITDLKFIKAKELLSTSDKPIREVIKEIGYYDASSFIRKFKKNFGMTPKEYRSLLSEERLEES